MPSNTIRDLNHLNETVLDLMYAMDQETGAYKDDKCENYPIGLWWYSQFAKPGTKVMTPEVCWSKRLAEMLDKKELYASHEFQYPGTRQRCDVRAHVGWEKPVWIELKGSWRAGFDPQKPNPAYKKHLYAAAKDIDKLCTLGSDDASGISFVLVGFDQPQTNVSIDVADMDIVRSRINGGGWIESLRTWDVRMSLSFRVQCWIWSRRLD
jgi:hypothetical protein